MMRFLDENKAMDRIFKRPFSIRGAISQHRKKCQLLFCLMKTRCCTPPARPVSSRETRETFPIAPLARSSKERRRRLALAGGFGLFRSSGIDRFDAAERGM